MRQSSSLISVTIGLDIARGQGSANNGSGAIGLDAERRILEGLGGLWFMMAYRIVGCIGVRRFRFGEIIEAFYRSFRLMFIWLDVWRNVRDCHRRILRIP